jgi:hypothetical protein
MPRKPARTGRPPRAPVPGERVSWGLKVTGEIKQRLDAVARANGRTQSQEAEVRLEQSFRTQDLLPQVLGLAYGQDTKALLLAFGEIMQLVIAVVSAEIPADASQTWFTRPERRHAVIAALLFVLRKLDRNEMPTEDQKGRQMANMFLRTARGEPKKNALLEYHMHQQELREHLRPLLEYLEANDHAR